MLNLDPFSLLPFAIAAIAIVFGFLFVVKKAAAKYFVVDATFDHSYDSGHRIMSIGGEELCVVCGRSGGKKCGRCKTVRYCSQACQSKHWNAEHKLKCKPVKSTDKTYSDPSKAGGVIRRRKSSGFGSISLVPARGSYKVLQEPNKILFSYDEFLKLFNWDCPGFPPCGLLNCGNSCFANVVLQCLVSTRPLTAYLLERDHNRACIRKQEDWCFLCELQAHIQRASQSRQPFSPTNILSRIPNIGGNLCYGSQEDAHEFMRFAIDTMQSICLGEHGGEKSLDPSTQETTLIQHIFGGHLQSQVKCTKCNAISNRYENMMDLTVEIHGDLESLEECLDQFTAKECLDGDNMYKCDGCNDYVKAWKRLTVHQAPNILTITLKRFQSGRFGKLNKRVTFPEELDLSPYMSDNGDGTDLYSLYAVVVHLDMLNASYFGHYICYTKDYYGQWHRIDDCKVTAVDVDEVLSQGAYMLLYSRRTARKKPFVMPIETARKKNADISNISNEANADISNVSNEAYAGISNISNEAHVSTDVASLPSHVDSKLNSGLVSHPSDTGPESNLSLMRDTGRDRLTALSTGQDNSDLTPMNATFVVVKNTDIVDSKSVKPATLDSKDNIVEDSVAISEINTKSSLQVPLESNVFLAYKQSESIETTGCELIKLDPSASEVETSNIEEDAAVSQTGINSYSQVLESNKSLAQKESGDTEMIDSELLQLGPNCFENGISNIKVDAVAQIVGNSSFQVPVEADTSLACKDLGDVDMIDSKMVKLGPNGSENESNIEEDTMAISQTSTSSHVITTSLIETMDMECEDSNISDANHIKDNLLNGNLPCLLPIASTSFSEEKTKKFEMKSEPVIAEHHPLHSINGFEEPKRQHTQNDLIKKRKPVFSRGFLDKPAVKEKPSYAASKIANCHTNGKSELNKYADVETSEMFRTASNISPSNSDAACVKRGLLYKSYTENGHVVEKEAVIRLNGNDSPSNSDKTFIKHGFLNKPHNENGQVAEEEAVLRLRRIDQPSNSDMTYIKRGFLDKSYNENGHALEEAAVLRLKGNDYSQKRCVNGFVTSE